MKKLWQVVVLLGIMILTTSVAMAATEKTTIQEGADLSDIKTIAIGMPLYMPVEKGDLTKEELVDVIYKPHKNSKLNFLSYDEVTRAIIERTNINIKTLDRRKAAKIFVENVKDFSDAYMIMTVANNKGIECFFDIYRTGTNELLYTFRAASGSSERGQDLEGIYEILAEKFYQDFDDNVKDQQRKKNKKK